MSRESFLSYVQRLPQHILVELERAAQAELDDRATFAALVAVFEDDGSEGALVDGSGWP